MTSCTCLMSDVDRNAGCRAISSASHSIDGNGVVGARIQVSDCGSGLRTRDCELLRITVTTWRKSDTNKE